jgi:hypothetical protein
MCGSSTSASSTFVAAKSSWTHWTCFTAAVRSTQARLKELECSVRRRRLHRRHQNMGHWDLGTRQIEMNAISSRPQSILIFAIALIDLLRFLFVSNAFHIYSVHRRILFRARREGKAFSTSRLLTGSTTWACLFSAISLKCSWWHGLCAHQLRQLLVCVPFVAAA